MKDNNGVASEIKISKVDEAKTVSGSNYLHRLTIKFQKELPRTYTSSNYKYLSGYYYLTCITNDSSKITQLNQIKNIISLTSNALLGSSYTNGVSTLGVFIYLAYTSGKAYLYVQHITSGATTSLTSLYESDTAIIDENIVSISDTVYKLANI